MRKSLAPPPSSSNIIILKIVSMSIKKCKKGNYAPTWGTIIIIMTKSKSHEEMLKI